MSLTTFAHYVIPAGGSPILIGQHTQIRYIWGSADIVKLTWGNRVYELTRGAWVRGPYASAFIEVSGKKQETVALEIGERDIDAVPHAPPAAAAEE